MVPQLFGALFPQTAPHPPQPPPPPHPSPFPYMPIDVLRRIMHIGGLSSKDILSVAATCRPLQRCTPMAYNSLHFPLDMTTVSARGMFRLQRTFDLLWKTLRTIKGHPTHIFRITLFAARPTGSSVATATAMERDVDSYAASDGISEAHLVRMALLDIDEQLSRLVSPETTPNLSTFILDASTTGQLLPFPYTLEALVRSQQRPLTELGLVRVCTRWGENAPSAFARDMPNVLARDLQVRRITVRSEDAQLSRAFLCKPAGVRALDFRESVQSSEPWEAVFGDGLRDTGSAREVRRLCLTCGGSNPQAEDHSDFVGYSLATGWSSLSALSISAFFKLEHLAALAGCPLRRLRLTVNVDDQFMPEFGPHLLSGIFNYFPDLEELLLDHMRATLYSYTLTEECLIEWAESIREARKFRVLALSTLFVLEPSDCGSDYADVGTVCSDVEMSDSMESSFNLSDAPSGKQVNLESPEFFVDDLAMFSESFFDKHLRSECLHELRFLYEDPENGLADSVGFRPQYVGAQATDDPDSRAYTAVPVDSLYDMFWEPRWRQRPADYLRSFLYTDEDVTNED